jgi:Tfp pilus assembly protein PilF
MKTRSYITAIIILSASASLHAASTTYCGDLKSSFGPFDYTNSENRSDLEVVENFHFTKNVEQLTKGNTGTVGGDLAYTLGTFPNHHRALMAFSKLVLRDKKLRPEGARYSIECYFDRAIRFKPNDGIVRMIYGIYLLKSGDLNKAIDQLNEANRLQPENANINYNLGLLYMKKKDYQKAKIHAKKAYELGFPLQGLKNMLSEAGHWNEPPAK